jgi:hypothetical protein
MWTKHSKAAREAVLAILKMKARVLHAEQQKLLETVTPAELCLFAALNPLPEEDDDLEAAAEMVTEEVLQDLMIKIVAEYEDLPTRNPNDSNESRQDDDNEGSSWQAVDQAERILSFNLVESLPSTDKENGSNDDWKPNASSRHLDPFCLRGTWFVIWQEAVEQGLEPDTYADEFADEEYDEVWFQDQTWTQRDGDEDTLCEEWAYDVSNYSQILSQR